MELNLTRDQVDALWEEGYRPYEIYTKNPEPVLYLGEMIQTGEKGGWDIKFVFAKREALATYPFFDVIIGLDSVTACSEVYHG